MERRSFIGSILALAAAPAIVRASSLMGLGREVPPVILVPENNGIVIATKMPPVAYFEQEGKRHYWPGADLPKRTDAGYDVMRFTERDAPVLCTRPDGILVMATAHALELSQTMGMPLTRVADDFKILDYRYPPPKRRTARQVEAQSRFNFVLGTFT